MRFWRLQLVAFFCLLGSTPGNQALAIDPVDPDLIPEARTVLDYLASIHGKATIAGQNTRTESFPDHVPFPNVQAVIDATGKSPALISLDLTGWNRPIWGDSYRKVLQGSIDGARQWWHERGGLVTMQWHWANPLRSDGSAWVQPPKGTGPFDVGRAVTPGTEEYQAVRRDLERTADYLQQLADARVPILFRPLHEIDGGWFWWTDKQSPENTAALWRMMFDYFVKERQLHNLIWVYSAGMGKNKGASERAGFYPGDAYVDIAGIDIYTFQGAPDFRTDGYQAYYDVMREVAPGKMLALTESQAIPNPEVLRKNGPKWLYALPWWGPGKQNPPEWVQECYRSDYLITLEALPDFKGATR